ncbi:4-hydroxy-tetrahydrodipicolinate synthase [Dethiosulfatibacter aminovorans DSM 17477]|uniref:4-hydroxy-tetrahydrodipicolinate synthase n=1 Tax=Dethiosulfatibacter aminovorans DSM 17477 TaxID=1121476 RepID=A0A1M6H505_9FIRM|nr:4-hydroxy-tetrahydrodipicolinate synthase [Dethiosulfatibacter aminovorans]SHJ17337.1 4-hydroxy-tetrahydrodipicolinate synthase [Dethiosulfatibacter aminovorans DSM 17477]
MLFDGAGTAIVTPFRNGEVDFDKYGELIDWQIEKGIDAIITCGTTGEGSTLSDAEHKKVMKYCVERVDGRVPVIAGTGSNDTAFCLQLSQYAVSIGVDGIMLVTPYYNKTTQRGLVNHYRFIAERVDIPIIIYNVPGRTGLRIEADTVVEISKIKNIVAMKDATGDISYAAEVMSKLAGTDFAIYSGNDDMVVPLMSLGARGVISVISNVMPAEVHDMVMKFHEGNIEESRRIQLELNDMIGSLFIEVNPIPVKTCMNMMGFDVGELRMPLYEMSEANKETLLKSMNKIGLVRR